MPMFRLPEQRISIHALFAEGDLTSIQEGYSKTIISIHALFAEGDLTPAAWAMCG